MIISALLQIVYYFLVVILSPLTLFSDVVINPVILSSFQSAQTWYSSLNAFIPADSLIAIIGLLLTIEVGIMTYKVIMWIKRLIPTMGG